MTLSTTFLLMAGKRISLTGRTLVEDTLTYGGQGSVSSLLVDVARFTFLLETAGAFLMFFCFLPGRDPAEALYMAVFHSISAFCNAGFSLFRDSFTDFRANWLFSGVACFLIVSGGIGFLVIRELKVHFPIRYRGWLRFSLHSKVVIAATTILLGSGTLLVLFLEWGNTLSALPFQERFLASFFQSVTARTAGFNTLPIAEMANATLFVFILLMFIGASPGSCGGGIKTTTLSTLLALGYSRFMGRERPQMFRRTIRGTSVAKAAGLVMLAVLVIVVGTLLLLMTELGELPHMASRGKFLELLFEVVSAFGTVGLSMGATPLLTTAGKLIIVMVMFLGRVGPLAVAMALSHKKSAYYHYAEEGIMIG